MPRESLSAATAYVFAHGLSPAFLSGMAAALADPSLAKAIVAYGDEDGQQMHRALVLVRRIRDRATIDPVHIDGDTDEW